MIENIMDAVSIPQTFIKLVDASNVKEIKAKN